MSNPGLFFDRDYAAPATSGRSELSSISCVVPCLNEANNLNELLPALLGVLGDLAPKCEIIVVDDGSTDATPAIVSHWAATHPQVVYVQFSRNFGKEAALSAGLEHAKGQVVVCMDSDFQHPPELIASMLERWYAGIDMVYGVRDTRQDEPWFKRIGSAVFYQLMRTHKGPMVPEHAGDFRLMDRSVVDALLMLPERNRFMKGLFAWVGFRTEPFYYSPPERLHGLSRFKPMQLLYLACDGLTAFTTWPLRVLSLVGLILSLASFAYGLYIVTSRLLYGDEVQGWTTLVLIVLFFAGVQLISVGVLGEYIARIFGEVKNRPIYIIRKRMGAGLDSPGVPKGPEAPQNKGEHGDAD